MLYVLENSMGGYFKRINRFNVAEVCDIGMAKIFKDRYKADFANSELRENFKVIEMTEENYIDLYNRWYDLKYTYQDTSINEINLSIK